MLDGRPRYDDTTRSAELLRNGDPRRRVGSDLVLELPIATQPLLRKDEREDPMPAPRVELEQKRILPGSLPPISRTACPGLRLTSSAACGCKVTCASIHRHRAL